MARRTSFNRQTRCLNTCARDVRRQIERSLSNTRGDGQRTTLAGSMQSSTVND